MTQSDVRPLEDLTVLDLTVARAGPTAVRQLADWGANVIRIEAPSSSGPIGSDSPDYLNLHRNKRSLTLDLKTPKGRALLHQLIERADVLVENMRAPVKTRLGFDWETVSKINPSLVMGSISGFGQTGPYAERGGVDQIAQGMSGMMSVTGLPGQGPVRAGAAISDIAAGLQLATGLLAALLERHRTGGGRWVHTSLLESMIGTLDFQAARWTIAGDEPEQAGNDHPTLIPMGLFQTSDGAINIAAAWGALWSGFCEVMGRPELATDVRFATPEARSTNRQALREIIESILTLRSTESWVDEFCARGIPAGPVLRVSEAFADPQVQHLRMTRPMNRKGSETVDVIRNPTQIEGVSQGLRLPTPARGEHTVAVLLELGLSSEEIAALRADGVV